MKHMVGKNWRDLFDMVIVQADKPNFFTDRRKYVSQGDTALLRGGLRFPAPFTGVNGFLYFPEKSFFSKHNLGPVGIQPSSAPSGTLWGDKNQPVWE